MKRYLVTEAELRRYMKLGDYIDAKEIAADARVLTREEFSNALYSAFLHAESSRDIDDYVNELFGKEQT